MKKLLFILLTLFALSFISCTNYHHSYKIEVTYENGDKEVITYQRESFNAHEVELVLDTWKKQPTLYAKCGGDRVWLASYVRSYKVLKHTKTELE